MIDYICTLLLTQLQSCIFFIKSGDISQIITVEVRSGRSSRADTESEKLSELLPIVGEIIIHKLKCDLFCCRMCITEYRLLQGILPFP